MAQFDPNLEANAELKKHPAPLAGQRSLAVRPISAKGHNSVRFVAGTALIAGSFLVYLAYPIILLIIPLSPSTKVGATVAIWLLSWATFSAGIFLAGPEGREWFKGLWSHLTGGRGRARQEGKNFSDEQSEQLGSVDSLGP